MTAVDIRKRFEFFGEGLPLVLSRENWRDEEVSRFRREAGKFISRR